jgi:hypothetical protein
MAAKKKQKKATAPISQSVPLNFTDEHVRMAREGRSKEAFETLLSQRVPKKRSK